MNYLPEPSGFFSHLLLKSTFASYMARLGFFLTLMPQPGIKLKSVQLHLFCGTLIQDTLSTELLRRQSQVFYLSQPFPDVRDWDDRDELVRSGAVGRGGARRADRARARVRTHHHLQSHLVSRELLQSLSPFWLWLPGTVSLKVIYLFQGATHPSMQLIRLGVLKLNRGSTCIDSLL